MIKLLVIISILLVFTSLNAQDTAEIEQMQIDSVNLGGKHIKPKEITTSKLNLFSGNKLYFDGGSDTYITEYSANQLRIYTGNTLSAFFSPTIVSVAEAFSVEAGKKIYLDGGTNDYLQLHSAQSEAYWVFGGATKIQLDSNGVGCAKVVPLSDNAYTCGADGLRWSAVWAANGTIQTSVSSTKKDIKDLEPEKVIVPKAATYLRKDDTHNLKHLGFIADTLPIECFAVYYDTTTSTYKRSTEDIYTDSVIGILCSKIIELEKRIKILEK